MLLFLKIGLEIQARCLLFLKNFCMQIFPTNTTTPLKEGFPRICYSTLQPSLEKECSPTVVNCCSWWITSTSLKLWRKSRKLFSIFALKDLPKSLLLASAWVHSLPPTSVPKMLALHHANISAPSSQLSHLSQRENLMYISKLTTMQMFRQTSISIGAFSTIGISPQRTACIFPILPEPQDWIICSLWFYWIAHILQNLSNAHVLWKFELQTFGCLRPTSPPIFCRWCTCPACCRTCQNWVGSWILWNSWPKTRTCEPPCPASVVQYQLFKVLICSTLTANDLIDADSGWS